MPDWLYRFLEDEEKQKLDQSPPGIPDILRNLLEQDQGVEMAYLCHSAARYVGKIKVKGKDEGDNFCGYHNIQVLISYVHATEVQDPRHFAGGIPTIWEMQCMIEDAWDHGFYESSRVQTGGIKGTRKHIGTPEVCILASKPIGCGKILQTSKPWSVVNTRLTYSQAQTLFRSLNIPCRADRFQNMYDGAKAYERLLDSVELYFSDSVTKSRLESDPRVQSTGLPPIYLQRPHHSLTVVGIEKRKSGSRNLLVFDPAYNPSKEMLRLLNPNSTTNVIKSSISLIKPYRRGTKYLERYHAFETLRLVNLPEPSLPVKE